MEILYLYRGVAKTGVKGESLIREAARLYGETEGLSVSESPILREKQGRPYFAHGLFSFSVSHSDGIWGCLFSREPACGLDLQGMRPTTYSKLLERFFKPEELAYAKDGGAEAFYRLWTRREAFGKWTGRGLFSALPDLREESGVWEGTPYFFAEKRISGEQMLRGRRGDAIDSDDLGTGWSTGAPSIIERGTNAAGTGRTAQALTGPQFFLTVVSSQPGTPAIRWFDAPDGD